MFDAKGLVGMLLVILILIEYTRKKVNVLRTFERQSIKKNIVLLCLLVSRQ